MPWRFLKILLINIRLESISDLVRVKNEVKAGFTLEFNDREDG